MSDGKPGLRIESAASIVARDMIEKHLHTFAHVIRGDRIASRSTIAEYVNGLAGAVALAVAGGQGSYEDVVNATVEQLRQYIARDLTHLARSRQ